MTDPTHQATKYAFVLLDSDCELLVSRIKFLFSDPNFDFIFLVWESDSSSSRCSNLAKMNFNKIIYNY